MQTPRKLFGGLGNSMFQMAYIYAQMREDNIPDIYVQNYKLWEKYGEEIKEWYGKDIVKNDYVSLHIRRGDYINNPFYVDLTKTDYYDKAISSFANKEFLIFCADRQDDLTDFEDQVWCMNWAKIKGIKFKIYRGGKNEIEDFNKMAGCKAHIMANSSFSFWASYIGGGITIAPSQWFADGTSISLPDNFKIL